ncbi:MAG: hypothetical protein MI674_01460, partial [Cytophagales bacterium]|nr:hypothetical protein [Cytophagales bacterium]
DRSLSAGPSSAGVGHELARWLQGAIANLHTPLWLFLRWPGAADHRQQLKDPVPGLVRHN